MENLAWSNFIAGIWADYMQELKMPKNGNIVEIAPGSVNKIGRGLEIFGFRGNFYVIEPNKIALTEIMEKYQKTLPGSIIRPIDKTLQESISYLPRKINAAFSNHPLDDMIVGKSLDDSEFQDFFKDHYDSPAEETRELWDRLISNQKRLNMAKQKVFEEWTGFLDRVRPELVIISQYESSFFSKNGIKEPDKQAYEVLMELRRKYSQNSITLSHSDAIKDPNCWLVLRF